MTYTAGNLDNLATEALTETVADLDLLNSRALIERIGDGDAQVAQLVAAAADRIADAVDVALDRWCRGGRIVLVGAGTSGRLAALDAAELPPTYGIDPDRYQARMAGGLTAFQHASEGAEDDVAAGRNATADIGPRDVAFGIAASGRTPYVLAALAAARDAGAATIGMACVTDPELEPVSDVLIVVPTGAEIVAGSTRMKAGTAQKLVLNQFSTTLMIRAGLVYKNLMVGMKVTNGKLRRRAARIVANIAESEITDAEQALTRSAGDISVAVTMITHACSSNGAREILDSHGWRLREVLASTNPDDELLPRRTS